MLHLLAAGVGATQKRHVADVAIRLDAMLSLTDVRLLEYDNKHGGLGTTAKFARCLALARSMLEVLQSLIACQAALVKFLTIGALPQTPGVLRHGSLQRKAC